MDLPNKGAASLRDIAVKLNKQRQLQPNDNVSNGRTLLIIGSKGTGKTSLINKFLDRNEAEKPTLALEYCFGRKAGKSLVKDVCHIWELGGGTLFTSLLLNSGPLDDVDSTTAIMMLDLSALENLWATMEILLTSLKTTILKKQKDPKLLIERAKSRVPHEHPDRLRMDPFPVPLVIIGGKYDQFQDYEPEKKKIVCRCLRYVAHFYNATLFFYSAKDSGLVKKSREILNHYGFGTPPVKAVAQDFGKPLLIPAGSDLLESIEGLGSNNKSWTMDKYKHIFTTHFHQETVKSTTSSEDPAQDPNFREPVIDALRIQKDEELERYCQELERRQKMKTTVY
ncbi:hypothetical protein LSTR_LSTR001075 [Laodelphax striatellus]|uniref:Cytoplasmic dynein 2 light intermediate chain 1 n=1 Tax=Laodelphax striatellus TaxID=195883 RepID=A0A482X147_LAOST|nr:hypothetical protein LSTR_LSTR001075 [Laodelphax striatellus]